MMKRKFYTHLNGKEIHWCSFWPTFIKFW